MTRRGVTALAPSLSGAEVALMHAQRSSNPTSTRSENRRTMDLGDEGSSPWGGVSVPSLVAKNYLTLARRALAVEPFAVGPADSQGQRVWYVACAQRSRIGILIVYRVPGCAQSYRKLRPECLRCAAVSRRERSAKTTIRRASYQARGCRRSPRSLRRSNAPSR